MRLQSSGTDECSSNEKDLWQSSIAANDLFYDNVQTCTFQNAASSNLTLSVQNCLEGIYSDLSSNCAACFGESVDCGATNCRGVCQDDTSSQNCQTCLSPCTSQLAVCTGTTNLPNNQTSTITTTKASVSVHHVSLVTVLAATFYHILS